MCLQNIQGNQLIMLWICLDLSRAGWSELDLSGMEMDPDGNVDTWRTMKIGLNVSSRKESIKLLHEDTSRLYSL